MAEESAPTEKKRSKTKLVAIVAAVALLGAGAALFLGGGGDPAAASEPAPVVEGDVVEIDTMTVNLVGEPGRYARVGFAVVLAAGADGAVVGAKLPLLRDAALTVMTGFDAAELQTAAGMERLRAELSDRAVALFPDGEVVRAVLTELIVQ